MASSNPATRLTEPVAPRIVGLGASAGGLVPLEQFFGQVPANSGMAYIVVQHLDPTQKALLAELLQRTTAMPVREAEHKMRIEPDCVYVIPPNSELSVVHGKLNLATPAAPRGLRLPIDVLFSSLARDQGEQSVAVVLSGMAADGTLGLQAIKAVGGLTAVQQPDTAQFDSMPKSAIAAGCADIVAPPAELPARILAYLTRLTALGPETETETAGQETSSADAAQSSPVLTPMQTVFQVLRERTRHDFSNYKSSTLRRRIDRRMAIHEIPTLARYADFLQDNAQEVDLLFKEVLIGVTNFFRDAAVWEHMAAEVVPELLARRSEEHDLRAWVIGCSSGEEAYSLAIVFTEAMQRLATAHEFSLQIFASDLSPDAISVARRGHYPLSIRDDVSEDRLARFFSVHETHYQINKNIRDMVLFAQHDVLLDPPFTRLDLLACRNLMIYLDAGLQRRLVPLFHYSLRPGGVLLLGSAETVGRSNGLFTPINSKLRTYLREDNATAVGLDFPVQPRRPRPAATKEIYVSPPTSTSTATTKSLQQAADRVLLQEYSPAAVVVGSQGDIVYISGRTGKYLEPAAGKANWNFHAMVREGLRARLADALHQAATQKEEVHLRGLKVQTSTGETQTVDVTVQALQDSAALKDTFMVVFRDVAPAPARGRRKAQSAEPPAKLQQCLDEIQSLREQNHTTREELESTNEELQSSNEELQSTNEELQSTNEELSTSKEEMQSMNEELQTINAELQTKLDDLALAQSDLSNILNSVDIAILFLDQGLNVRRYTDRAAKIINIRESDVGRPLSDLTTKLEYPALHDDAAETLRTLAICEKEIHTTDDRWFSVRIIPYRRLDNVIDGVVLTLVDISASKALESSLRAGAKD
ncbi:MAG TPA: chemotaxis protein CheB [Gammaproteobacteria bacterium]|nr:chemotaxis protein CheB [Gammaproteobacteria bacterium]